MRSEWKEYTVQALIDAGMLEEPLDGNHGGIHPKSSDYVEEGVPFIMASDLGNGVIDYSSCKFITETQAKTLRKGFAKFGDVLLTHKATLGRTAIVDNRFEYIVLTPQVTYYRAKAGLDNRYLKYYFDSREFQSLFYNWAASGSTRNYLGITAQKKLPILVPSFSEQRAIAATLSCLDDKIELNSKINANLEAQAQSIFKRWFVDFEPWDGVMPDDWSSGSLLDIADYLNGLAMQKFRPSDGEIGLPVLKIKELRQGGCDSSSELCSPNIRPDYIVHDGDVIFSWSGSLLVDFWCGGNCGLNQHLFKVTSTKYDKWFYYMWTCHHLNQFIAMAADKATTMGHIKREALANAKVLIPSQEDYETIGKLLAPVYEFIINNRVENRNLASIRDTLLPKLMSGDVEVPLEG